jgi:REP element-mobilizing transposase RayT
MGDDLTIYKRNLPHWRMTGATYFVTFSLFQDQPSLSDSERDFIQRVLLDHHKVRYHLWAWVVMNDHVHAVLTPLEDWQLAKILHTWKSFSANRMQRLFGRSGQIWLHESFDRIVRNEYELYQKCEYILTNPRRRWPDVQDYRWVGYRWMQ